MGTGTTDISDAEVGVLQNRLLRTFPPRDFVVDKINDFYTLAMLLSLRRTGISATDLPAAVEALSGFSSHINSNDNVWPSCRNLFSYRVSVSTPWEVIHNAPAILVNTGGGTNMAPPLFYCRDQTDGLESVFVLWVDDETSSVSNLYGYDGHTRGRFGLPGGSSVGVVPFSSGLARGHLAVTPDNRISDMRNAPKIVQPLIRFLRSPLACGALVDTQSVNNFIAGETGLQEDKIAYKQTTKAGNPGRLTNARSLLRKRGISYYNGQPLPLGALCTKLKGRVRLHTMFPNASVLGMEPAATYTLSPKLARQIIPKVVEALSRTSLLSSKYAWGPARRLLTDHLGNSDSNALVYGGVYIGLDKYSEYINKLKRHSVIGSLNREARGVIHQEYAALRSLCLYCIDDLVMI